VRQLTRRSESALGKLRHHLEQESGSVEAGRETEPARGRSPRPARRPSDMAITDESYRIEILKEAEGGWTASAVELPGCVTRGATREQAAARVDEAIQEWIADARAHGREIPKPRGAASHSGRLLVRMPRSLHADLSHAAEREEVSLNQFITSVLASAVGWRLPNTTEQTARPLDDSARRRALSVNLVVLGVVGLTALVLLAIELAQRL